MCRYAIELEGGKSNCVYRLIKKDMLERYNKVFAEIFEVGSEVLGPDFTADKVDNWDSVLQLSLVDAIEEEFDVMLDTDDILNFNSYEGGKEILAKQDVKLD
jgi:acyl carrier protein